MDEVVYSFIRTVEKEGEKMKDNIIEFLFNSKKYKKLKMSIHFIFLIIYSVVYFKADVSQIFLFFIVVLLILLLFMLLQTFWYHPKKNVKTTIKDRVLICSTLVLLVYSSISFYQL